MGLLARPAAELDPTKDKWPPGNFLCKTVLPLSLDLDSATRSFIFLESLIIAANLSFENDWAMARVGCTTNNGLGS